MHWVIRVLSIIVEKRVKETANVDDVHLVNPRGDCERLDKWVNDELNSTDVDIVTIFVVGVDGQSGWDNGDGSDDGGQGVGVDVVEVECHWCSDFREQLHSEVSLKVIVLSYGLPAVVGLDGSLNRVIGGLCVVATPNVVGKGALNGVCLS